MAKKSFKFPVVFVAAGGVGDDTVIGKGSGNNPVDPLGPAPCSYQYWVDYYFDETMDLALDGADLDDFGRWWVDNIGADENSIQQFLELNPGLSWDKAWEE